LHTLLHRLQEPHNHRRYFGAGSFALRFHAAVRVAADDSPHVQPIYRVVVPIAVPYIAIRIINVDEIAERRILIIQWIFDENG